jgi:hypothetical protein
MAGILIGNHKGASMTWGRGDPGGQWMKRFKANFDHFLELGPNLDMEEEVHMV